MGEVFDGAEEVDVVVDGVVSRALNIGRERGNRFRIFVCSLFFVASHVRAPESFC